MADQVVFYVKCKPQQAVLHGQAANPLPLPGGLIYWDRATIAGLLDKHRAKIPLALTLGLPIR
ncbi:MAG TPA: hypothetical protein VGX76_04650 [Pirellulales bacterium]|jgi:hypothetical protein|nr:hypothetical protein [Pirellulales bacterium]